MFQAIGRKCIQPELLTPSEHEDAQQNVYPAPPPQYRFENNHIHIKHLVLNCRTRFNGERPGLEVVNVLFPLVRYVLLH